MCFSSLVVWWDVISYRQMKCRFFFFSHAWVSNYNCQEFSLITVHVYLALWVQSIWELQGAGVQWLWERKPTDICYEQLIPGIMAFQHFLIWGPWKMLGVQCTAEHFKSANNTLPFPLAFFKRRGWGACPDYTSSSTLETRDISTILVCLFPFMPWVFLGRSVRGWLRSGLWCHLVKDRKSVV